VHSLTTLALAGGGLPKAACGLASAQAAIPGVTVHIVHGSDPIAPANPLAQGVKVHAVSQHWPLAVMQAPSALQPLLSGADAVLHDHGLWQPFNLSAAGFAARRGLPYVISTHGMLEPWALAHRGLRKRWARRLYQDHLLRGARCLMTTSAAEFEHLRQLGFSGPVAVIPIGIEPGTLPPASRPARETRIALFLSRIHPIKGVIHAIEAWQAIKPQGWRLKIVGPSELGHREQLERLVRSYGLEQSVSFHDAVAGAEKSRCLDEADVFLLPSHSENFGIVVGEALACGLPVVTTTGTPWAGLLRERCGWYVQPGTESMVGALREVFTTSPQELRAMGERGRQWIQRDFAWDRIATQSLATYQWILGQGAKPEMVYN
jgi:glycosyltransferase involved in cell wall biosynthesis